MRTSITEALQELKTIQKRILAKREALLPFIARPNQLKDPFEKDGGSYSYIKRERQSISDLENRFVKIRTAIQRVNLTTFLSLDGTDMSIAEWTTWRRDMAAGQKDFLFKLSNGIKGLRQETVKKGNKLVDASTQPGETDVVVHLNEKELLEEQDQLEKRLGDLDGKLSLLNATTFVEID